MDGHICFHVEGEGLVVQGGHSQWQISGLGPRTVCVRGFDRADEVYDVEQWKNFSVIH